MSPTHEELELGAKAYQRMRLYEKSAARNARQTFWILMGSVVIVTLGAFLLKPPFSRHDSHIFFIFMPAAMVSWVYNRMAKESYANQKLMLRLLEEKYGDALPWVVEEKQLARARELETEIAQSRHPVGHA